MARETETRFALEMKGDLPTVPGLSAKEIKRLRQGVTHRGWINAAFALFILSQLAGAASKLYQLRLLFPGITWSQACKFGFARNFPVNGMYSGAEIRAASLAEDVFVYLLATAFFIGMYFVIRAIRRKDIILLQYIDRDGTKT